MMETKKMQALYVQICPRQEHSRKAVSSSNDGMAKLQHVAVRSCHTAAEVSLAGLFSRMYLWLQLGRIYGRPALTGRGTGSW